MIQRMRPRIHTLAMPELGDFADEVRRVYFELGRAFGPESLAGECSPAIDVYETDDTMEIAVDLPGVAGSAIRVMVKGDSVLVAGEKAARRTRGESSFHLVERGYGRFARVGRLGFAGGTRRAQARLTPGEPAAPRPEIRYLSWAA